MGMMPGIPKEARDVEIDDGHIARIEGIIHSMTPAERVQPDIIDGSRRQRIATGSGVQPNEVKQLLDQFTQMRKMMKQFAGFGTKKQNPKARSRARRARSARAGASPRRGARRSPRPRCRCPVSKTATSPVELNR